MYDETFDKFAMVEKEHLLEEEEQVRVGLVCEALEAGSSLCFNVVS